ncbi:dihydropteroate synthase [Rubritalea marina]|uniref:dihydropteroate synthase n=1 Tax=Rubritalea marina TaxID=361055 RepID=UPI00035F53E5|nr:dihydropteroate synthase [Rubritalea marina]
MRWKLKSRVVDLTETGMIAGILNVTPDSFSDGGKFINVSQAVQHAIGMLQDGAEIIDIGGESTRPGSLPVSADEEIKRVVPVIQALREASNCLISIDTSKAEVARQAIEAGADIVNDVSGLTQDVNMPRVCAETGVGVIVMHRQGTPDTMQVNPEYQDVVREIRKFFEERYRTLTRLGVNPQSLCFDPGIGFGKTLEHNLELLHRLSGLIVNNRPIMLGVSRKSMIGAILGLEDAQSRDAGTAALTATGRMAGAQIHRVHEIRANYEAMRMAEAVLNIGE